MRSVDSQLLGSLVCPLDKGELQFIEPEQILYNPRLQKAYAIRNGIPVLLADDARSIDDSEHERLVALNSKNSPNKKEGK